MAEVHPHLAAVPPEALGLLPLETVIVMTVHLPRLFSV
jgi:hypothetical protein